MTTLFELRWHGRMICAAAIARGYREHNLGYYGTRNYLCLWLGGWEKTFHLDWCSPEMIGHKITVDKAA